jgi:2-oxo-4-hydroxy-4-carboxy-5-ureidoimidazoline decarboxylase
MPSVSLDQLNAMPPAEFAAALAGIFEHGPWVAEATAAKRPFATITALHDAMLAAVRARPEMEQIAFLRGHPELAGLEARAGALTADSTREQASLGLADLPRTDAEQFAALNAAYDKRFGFPFIICVRHHTRDAILQRFERRLGNDAATEKAIALAEIAAITRLRLVAKVSGPGAPKTDGRLSTHVLDTVSGRPAPGVRIELSEIGPRGDGRIVSTVTNNDGRTDAPLIGGGPLRIGSYELQFHIGDYFKRSGTPAADPAYLDIVPIRFQIAEPTGHYHVPLLASPWSYTTYRGS